MCNRKLHRLTFSFVNLCFTSRLCTRSIVKESEPGVRTYTKRRDDNLIAPRRKVKFYQNVNRSWRLWNRFMPPLYDKGERPALSSCNFFYFSSLWYIFPFRPLQLSPPAFSQFSYKNSLPPVPHLIIDYHKINMMRHPDYCRIIPCRNEIVKWRYRLNLRVN